MATTEFDDSQHYGIFTTSATLTSQTGKMVRQSELVLSALRAQGAFDNLIDGTTPPATDKLWLDKNSDPAVLKEWDSIGSAWSPMTFDRLFGRAVVTALENVGGTANAVTVDKPATFFDNRLYSITPAADNTGAVTITVAGVGVYNVVYHDGTALSASEFTTGQNAVLLFTSGRFEVLYPFAPIRASEIAAGAAADRAETARAEAAGYAAGLNMPPIQPGDAGRLLYVKNDESGFELPEQAISGSNLLTDVRTATAPLIILATGQSNMALPEKNQADTSFSTYSPAPNLKVWNNPDFSNAVSAGDTSTDATGSAFISPPTDRLLLSLATANEIAKANPQRMVYVVSTGYSGQPIAQWMTGASAPDVYAITKANIEAALAAISRSSVDLLLWWQGESDATSTSYPFEFQTVINRFYTETWFARSTQMMIFGLGSTAITGIAAHDPFNGILRRVVSQEPQFRTFVDTSWVPPTNWDAFLHARLTGYSKIGKEAAEMYMGQGNKAPIPFSGQWTPKLYVAGSDAGAVYHGNTQGFWSRTGTLVTVAGLVQLTTKPSGTGGITISLPFPTNSISTAQIVADSYPSTVGSIQGYANQFQMSLVLVRPLDSAGNIILPQITEANINDTFRCRFSITYDAIVDALGGS